MDKDEFEGFESVKYWMNSLPGPDGIYTTKYQWKIKVRKYCEWLRKTPDELIEERRRELKSEDPRTQHRAEQDVKRFLRYLKEEKGCKPNTRRGYFTAIRSFYDRNYAELKFFKGDGPRIKTVRKGSTAATKNEIKQMIEVSDPRDRALILFLKDTGLSVADTSRLTIGDLEISQVEDIFRVKPPVLLSLNRKKTDIQTITFVGEEALEALRTTFKIRMRGSPELKIRDNASAIEPEHFTMGSPLFRSYSKFLGKSEELEHLNPHTISNRVRKAAIQADVYKKGFAAHALRRFFQTSLESSGMNGNWIKRMMGHRLPGVEGSYSKPEIEMLREAYRESYPYLAISEHVEQRSRVEALERQVEALVMNGKRKDGQIERLEAERSEVAELKKDIATVTAIVHEMRKKKTS